MTRSLRLVAILGSTTQLEVFMKSLATWLLLVLCLLLCVPATADDLYDNGPTNGNEWAYLVNFGSVVSDTFTLNNCVGLPWDPGCSISGMSFAAWLFPGDDYLSAEVLITSDEFGGTTYFDQVVNFTSSDCVTNGYGFSMCRETGQWTEFTLQNGSYWLNLQNASVPSGEPVYWDENSGPSLASQNSVGTIPSESFTLLGTSTTVCWWCYTTPEPGSSLLFGSGAVTVFAFLGLLRRNLF